MASAWLLPLICVLMGYGHMALAQDAPADTLTSDTLSSTVAGDYALRQSVMRPAPFWRPDTTFNPRRFWPVVGGSAAAFGGIYTWLGFVWYADQPQTSFHWYDDLDHWQQMDKMGHAYWSYQESRLMMDMLRWSGVPRNKWLLWGGMAGFLLQAPIEILDGHVETYGASPSDLAANGVGSALAIANELIWQEQRINFKFSFFPSNYGNKRPDLLGDGADKLIKDYNAQTYWLSVPLHPFIKRGNNGLPPWLMVSVGHNGQGMIGGYGEDDPADIRAREYRRWLLSVDVDFTKIPTRSGFLRTVFYLANMLKFPAPAISLERGQVRLWPVYY